MSKEAEKMIEENKETLKKIREEREEIIRVIEITKKKDRINAIYSIMQERLRIKKIETNINAYMEKYHLTEKDIKSERGEKIDGK